MFSKRRLTMRAGSGLDRFVLKPPPFNLVATIAILSILHVFTRLNGLLALPPFLDESLLIARARELVSATPGLWKELALGGRITASVSVVATAQVMGVLAPAFSPAGATVDWLLAGRIATVAASLVSMLGVFCLSKVLCSSRAAVLAALFYIFVPFTYFHDRLVMAETFLSAFGLVTMLVSVQVVRGRITSAIPLAVSLVLVLLSKILPALFFVVLPLGVWLWFRKADRSDRSLTVMLRSYALFGMIVVVAVVLAGPERVTLAADSMLSAIGGDQFGGEAPSIARIPQHIVSYTGVFLGWFSHYLAPWFIVLLALATLLAAARRDRSAGLSLLAGAGFIVAFLVVPGWVASRYIVPGVVLLAPGLGMTVDFSLARLREWYGSLRDARAIDARRHMGMLVSSSILALYVGVLVWGAAFQLQAVQQPSKLDLTEEDRRQYVEDWPSGYGFPEAISWIKADSAGSTRTLVIGRYLNSSFDTIALASGLEAIVVPELRYFAYPRELDEDTRMAFSERLRDPSSRVYYLEARADKQAPPTDHMVETMRVVPAVSFPKPGGKVSIDVYRVLSTPEWVESRTYLDLLLRAREGRLRVASPPGADPGAYVHVQSFVIDGQEKEVIYMHPTSAVSITTEIPRRASLEFSIALDPETWDLPGDGVDFAVEVLDGDKKERLFSASADPSHDPTARRWIDESVSLERFAGREVTLTLATSPRGSLDFDWAGWGRPKIVVP